MYHAKHKSLSEGNIRSNYQYFSLLKFKPYKMINTNAKNPDIAMEITTTLFQPE